MSFIFTKDSEMFSKLNSQKLTSFAQMIVIMLLWGNVMPITGSNNRHQRKTGSNIFSDFGLDGLVDMVNMVDNMAAAAESVDFTGKKDCIYECPKGRLATTHYIYVDGLSSVYPKTSKLCLIKLMVSLFFTYI